MSASPSLSPPRTPAMSRLPSSKASTPNSDDSSIIDDLSFDYIFDQDGNFVRLSKGSSKSNHSTPPTPQDDLLPKPASQDLLISPVPRISLTRSESAFPVLSTAANAQQPSDEIPARSFQRASSGPAISMTAAPALKPRVAARRVTMEESRERHDSVGSSRTRQTLDSNGYAYSLQDEKENISESDDKPHVVPPALVVSKTKSSPPVASRSTSAASTRFPPARSTYLSNSGSNAVAKPLADLPNAQRAPYSRQIMPGPSRAGRIMKSTAGPKYSTSLPQSNIERISESEASDGDHPYPVAIVAVADETEPEDEPPKQVEPEMIPLPSSIPSTSHLSSLRPRSHVSSNMNGFSQSDSTRPRRSASLNQGQIDEYQMQLQHPYQNSNSRPGTSLGLNADVVGGARRVTHQEREKMDQDLRAEYKKYRSKDDEKRNSREQEAQPRQSPSPTDKQSVASSRTQYGHRRRDSDTLRGITPSTSSPTVVNSHSSASSPLPSRPQVKVTPPNTKIIPAVNGRLSPVGREVAKHRRSPTAPEPPTTSGMMREGNAASHHPVGRTWAGAERMKEDEHDFGREVGVIERGLEREKLEHEREKDRDYERERERERKLSHQPHLSLQHPPQPVLYTQSLQVQPHSAQGANRQIWVNKKNYARLDMIGKGGSSRVFRVLSPNNDLFAIKRVTLDRTDAETMNGYMNEMALLKRLDGNNRIIRLIDSEVKPGPGGSKGHLLLVMECGEIDFARMLQMQMKEPVNMVWVAYYWQQMLQAVHVIHEEKIVHSDLKPANFVLVRGQLKLIDFGIANAIANDTTNIQRESQIGTVNYMSPEAIEVRDGLQRLKVGRASDIWSLGCILYQMVYGQPPFQHIPHVYQKMRAIPDVTYVIDYPEFATPLVPSPRHSAPENGHVEPPKRLDHLKRRVRKDVIMSIKSCLCRNPKERATIPDLLNQGWLAMQEPDSTPAPVPIKELALKDDETIINPHYMQQLLEYGLRLAKQGEMSPEALQSEALRLIQDLKAVNQQIPSSKEGKP